MDAMFLFARTDLYMVLTLFIRNCFTRHQEFTYVVLQ